MTTAPENATPAAPVPLDFSRLVKVAHHIPGRIRLKLADGMSTPALAAAEVQRFVRAATAAPGIRSVSVNPLARSCVVEYDPVLFPPSAWSDAMAGRSSPAAQALLQALAVAP